MNQTSFRHLSFVTDLGNDKLRIVKPNGYPIRSYHKLEYVRSRSPKDAINRVTSNLDSSFLSSHYKQHHRHKRDHFLAGHCVSATMCCLYLLNDHRFVPFSCLDDTGIVHWWFTDMVEQQIYDPTAAQYDQTTLSELYEKGKPTPYYGWGQRPAKRFLDLLKRTDLLDS